MTYQNKNNLRYILLLTTQENPHTTFCDLAVGTFLKSMKNHPHIVQLLQELAEDDFNKHVGFCKKIIGRCHRNPNFVTKMPHTLCVALLELHIQYPQKVNVWSDLGSNRI